MSKSVLRYALQRRRSQETESNHLAPANPASLAGAGGAGHKEERRAGNGRGVWVFASPNQRVVPRGTFFFLAESTEAETEGMQYRLEEDRHTHTHTSSPGPQGAETAMKQRSKLQQHDPGARVGPPPPTPSALAQLLCHVKGLTVGRSLRQAASRLGAGQGEGAPSDRQGLRPDLSASFQTPTNDLCQGGSLSPSVIRSTPY
ncbi:hypothetical protein GGR56DRAFT_619797, partial [Xylariaceae sp. FL0804]